MFVYFVLLWWIKENTGGLKPLLWLRYTNKQTNLLLSAPLKPVLLSCALLSLILLCSSVYHQRYFPAVHNRLTNHKKKHLLACFLVYCDTTSTH